MSHLDHVESKRSNVEVWNSTQCSNFELSKKTHVKIKKHQANVSNHAKFNHDQWSRPALDSRRKKTTIDSCDRASSAPWKRGQGWMTTRKVRELLGKQMRDI